MQLFTGKQYLQIDIANNFGLDKEDWDVRLDWFEKNQHQLDKLVKDAEEPALFYASIQAWKDVQKGLPIGYPISLDATASGFQILAALTGDIKAAKLCNVVDAGGRKDAYTEIYQTMLEKTGGDSRIERSAVKKAVMTSLYGSEAEPKRVFGEGPLLAVFENTMGEEAPAVWELNKAFLHFADPKATEYCWVLPDNFHVITKVKNKVKDTFHFMGAPYELTYEENSPTEHNRSLGANTTHSLDGMIVREVSRRCNYDPERILNIKTALCEVGVQEEECQNSKLLRTLMDHYHRTKYLSSRVLECIDNNSALILTDEEKEAVWTLIYSLPKKPFEVIAVHDCFRVLPNYGNDLRTQYNNQLAMIAESNLLSDILSQITGRTISINKMTEGMEELIRKTNYALS